MAQAASSGRRLQPATIALAVAALIAVGVLVYTLAFRRGEGAASPAANASIATNAAAGADPGQQAAIAAAKVPFAITHAPGYMLVTDLKNAQLAV